MNRPRCFAFATDRSIAPARALLIAAALVLAATTGCAARQEVVLEEEWLAVSMAGARVGFVHTVVRAVFEPEPVVVTTVSSETRLQRFGVAISISSHVEYRETPAGAILSASSRSLSSQMKSVTEAVVRGDRMVVTTEMAGNKHTNEIPWDREVIGPYAQGRRIREAGLAPGTSISFKAFIPEHQRIASSTVTIEGPDKLTLDGETLDVWRGTMTQDILPGVTTQVWLDKDGNIVRSVTDILGKVETVRTTREKALKEIISGEMADVMTRFFIRSNVLIDDPARIASALFRIEGDLKALDGLTLEDRRQTIEKRTGNAIFLRVRALGDAAEPTGESPGEEFLASSPYIQSADPEIVRLAREAVGDAATPSDKAKRLEAWVYDNVKKKDYTVGFASAKEVAVLRQGDCTEHAVFLAALLRAEKIPSRIAVGVVYWKGMFGYHMWTEAYLNDWTAFDATLLSEKAVDATHIKFSDASLKTSSAAEPFLSLVPVIGNIKLTVEEIER